MKKFTLMMLCAALCCACSDEGNDDIDFEEITPAERIELTKAEGDACVRAKEFAFDFVRKVNTLAAGENYFVSPLSAEIALAMLCNGAAGETEQEIRQILGFEEFTIEDLNSYNRKMLQTLPDIDPRTKVALADGFWANEMYPIKTSFQNLITNQYDGSCATFKDLPKVRQEINSWCDKHTKHMIQNVVGDDDLFDFMLANALYFKGEWTSAFDSGDTKNKTFHNQDGSEPKVKMMHKTKNMKNFEGWYNDYCRVLYMPFGNRAYNLAIVVPADGYTLDACAERLDYKTLLDKGRMICMGTTCTLVEMPRFDLSYECPLDKVLQGMGVNLLFAGKPDLSQMFDFEIPDDVLIDVQTRQKARIEVNEQGAKAAAVTTISLGINTTSITTPPSVEWSFVVDEPFLFFISEGSTGTILFSGRVNNLE